MAGHVVFFFNDTATTEIYTLSLHDALPISPGAADAGVDRPGLPERVRPRGRPAVQDRKSTRLNSSHGYISYAVFCLKKKKGLGSSYLHDSHAASTCTLSSSHPPPASTAVCL